MLAFYYNEKERTVYTIGQETHVRLADLLLIFSLAIAIKKTVAETRGLRNYPRKTGTNSVGSHVSLGLLHVQKLRSVQTWQARMWTERTVQRSKGEKTTNCLPCRPNRAFTPIFSSFPLNRSRTLVCICRICNHNW